MKTWMYSLLGLALLAGCAAAPVMSGAVYFRNANVKVDDNSVGNFDKAMMENRTRYLNLSLNEFLLVATGASVTAATEPGSVIANNVPAFEWAQGETAKVGTTFRVPEDYVSGGKFICSFSLDAASSDTTVDFEIYVNVDGSAYDAATTNQTPVAMTNTTANNVALTLTPATDTFAAGNFVTFNVWRAAGTGAGSNLNLLNCYLSYTADM